MDNRIGTRIDVQPRKGRDWKPGVVIGGLLALAGAIVTIAAAYQLQITAETRRAAQIAPPAPATTPNARQQAQEELAQLRLERDKARAAAWRARVDADTRAANDPHVRCYSGVRMIKERGEWRNAGSC